MDISASSATVRLASARCLQPMNQRVIANLKLYKLEITSYNVLSPVFAEAVALKPPRGHRQVWGLLLDDNCQCSSRLAGVPPSTLARVADG